MKKDLILSKQLAILEKQEQKFLNHTDSEFIKSNFTPVVDKIQAKIPDKLQSTLDAAFYVGFHLVFEKGTSLIEKTYNKEKIDVAYDLNNYAIEKYMTKKHLKTLYLICTAMTKEDQRKAYDQKIERLGQEIDIHTPTTIDLDAIMKETSDLLSNTLLTAKFIQGLPLVGVIGGVINPMMINKVGRYARIKYKKRYLLSKINAVSVNQP